MASEPPEGPSNSLKEINKIFLFALIFFSGLLISHQLGCVSGTELEIEGKNFHCLATPISNIADELSISLDDCSYFGSKDFSGVRLKLSFVNRNEKPVKITVEKGQTGTGISLFNDKRELTEPLDTFIIAPNGAVSREYYLPRIKPSETQGDKLLMVTKITSGGKSIYLSSQLALRVGEETSAEIDRTTQTESPKQVSAVEKAGNPLSGLEIKLPELPELDEDLITLIAFLCITGLLIGFVRSKTKYRRRKTNKYLWTLLWIPFVFLALPALESQFRAEILQVDWLFYLVSLVMGFIYSYMLTNFIDRKLGHSDMHIWLRKIFAGLLVLGGILLFISSFAAAISNGNDIMGISITSITSMFIGISFGLIVFASYLTFTYMRRSGIIVHAGEGWR